MSISESSTAVHSDTSSMGEVIEYTFVLLYEFAFLCRNRLSQAISQECLADPASQDLSAYLEQPAGSQPCDDDKQQLDKFYPKLVEFKKVSLA